MSKPRWMSDEEWDAFCARCENRQAAVIEAELEFARQPKLVTPEQARELQDWFDA